MGSVLTLEPLYHTSDQHFYQNQPLALIAYLYMYVRAGA